MKGLWRVSHNPFFSGAGDQRQPRGSSLNTSLLSVPSRPAIISSS